MKLKVKDMDIETGGILIALLNENDARKLDMHPEDRIGIYRGKKKAIAVLDIAESKKACPEGQVGLFEEMLDLLGVKHGDIVDVVIESKPESLGFIKKKMDGKRLKPKEIETIVEDIVSNDLTTIELTYFISACYTHGLSLEETVALTKAMIKTGDILKLDKYPIVDKHCLGGVAGNRTTMIVVPILAAAGLTVPKTSSRSITSPAGTADTMEVLCNVCHSIKSVEKIVKKVGGCITWGGAVNLAPADDKIIKVENPLRIDAEGNMLSSIMAKKGSMSSTHVIIDIPLGKGAKIESRKEAEKLSREFKKIGNALGMKIKVLITDGSQPIGNGIGPALEARDVLWLLKNDKRAPQDLRKKSLMLAEETLGMCGMDRKIAKEMLESGKAYKKMIEIINAQGKRVTDPDKINPAKLKYDYRAKKSGKIIHIDNGVISRAARLAGAPQDKSAGIYLYKHKGDRVKKGEIIFTLYAEIRQKLEFAVDALKEGDGIIIN
jgi:AMP phosphorylase